MSSSVVERIDRAIKQIWLEDIKRDYFADLLFREDCLKNCLYYHLRRRLGDGYLRARRIRVYTEYVLKPGERLDLAVVRLRPMRDMSYGYGIDFRMEQILAAIECKYKRGHVPTEPFLSDLRKVRRLSRRPELKSAQFYMALSMKGSYLKRKRHLLTVGRGGGPRDGSPILAPATSRVDQDAWTSDLFPTTA